MSGLSPTELKFEEHIEKHLNSIGYSSTNFSEYDRNLCLIKDQVINFIKQSQPKNWEKLNESHGSITETKLLQRISQEISKR